MNYRYNTHSAFCRSRHTYVLVSSMCSTGIVQKLLGYTKSTQVMCTPNNGTALVDFLHTTEQSLHYTSPRNTRTSPQNRESSDQSTHQLDVNPKEEHLFRTCASPRRMDCLQRKIDSLVSKGATRRQSKP